MCSYKYGDDRLVWLHSDSMNSQNHYHLTFNPRGPRQPRPQPHLRYVPTLKSNYAPSNGYRPQYTPYSPTHAPPEPWSPPPPAPPQHSHHEHHDTSYTSHSSSLSVSKREEAKEQERQKQAEIMKRVKELQERVMPLVEGNDDDEPDAGFQSRVELKLMRI